MSRQQHYDMYISDEELTKKLHKRPTFSKVPTDQSIFGATGVKVNQIVQQAIGDCFFLASVKATVRRNPKVIHDIIQEVASDPSKVIVKFYYLSTSYGVTTYQPIKIMIDKTIDGLIRCHAITGT